MHTLWFQTLYVFFFVAHDRRTVMHVNVTAHPTATWVWRQLINATPWGNSPRFLIRDRDRSYGGDFIERAKRIGIHTVLTPIATPQANGIAERLVGTFRRECLDHIIIVNERHLRYALREFVRHYNEARPHQALDLEAPEPRTGPPSAASGPIVSRPVLGGLTTNTSERRPDGLMALHKAVMTVASRPVRFAVITFSPAASRAASGSAPYLNARGMYSCRNQRALTPPRHATARPKRAATSRAPGLI